MCGIAGVITRKIDAGHEKLLADILVSQKQRGPDHEGRQIVGGRECEVIMGHNRLSIIDLSAESNQPMQDTQGRYCITFNGEIYNYLELREELREAGYQFRTQGDTEVILHAFAHWGVESLNRFNGPFAFALYDRSSGLLWLCRDRFGVRPLYYVIRGKTLWFASSATVLAKTLGLSPNMAYVARGLNYLVYENGDDLTPFEGLNSLLAGHALRVGWQSDEGVVPTLQQYYHLEGRVSDLAETLAGESTDSLIERTSHCLGEAVTLRLRSDVPLGITLSSGLDSSAVAAMVRERHDNTTGFSFGDPSDRVSEGPLVERCAKYLGLRMVYVNPKPSEMVEALFQTISAQEAPFSTLSIVAQYLLYKQIHASGIKVILGGQGGDEVFMGYRKFIWFWLRSLMRQKKYIAGMKNLLQLIPMMVAEMSALPIYWKNRHRYLAGNRQESGIVIEPSPVLTLGVGRDGSLQNRQMDDIVRYSLPTLLRYEDRNAMGNSVESRLPFMDWRLVELGVALPEALKIRAGHGKWPVRKVLEGKIPDRIRLARKKRGFDVQTQALLQAGLGTAIRETLEANKQLSRQFMRPGLSIREAFSDRELVKRRGAMTEAITLLWLERYFR